MACIRPRKHRLVVELTDMELGRSTKAWLWAMRDILEAGMPKSVANLQVKDFTRVVNGLGYRKGRR